MAYNLPIRGNERLESLMTHGFVEDAVIASHTKSYQRSCEGEVTCGLNRKQPPAAVNAFQAQKASCPSKLQFFSQSRYDKSKQSDALHCLHCSALILKLEGETCSLVLSNSFLSFDSKKSLHPGEYREEYLYPRIDFGQSRAEPLMCLVIDPRRQILRKVKNLSRAYFILYFRHLFFQCLSEFWASVRQIPMPFSTCMWHRIFRGDFTLPRGRQLCTRFLPGFLFSFLSETVLQH